MHFTFKWFYYNVKEIKKNFFIFEMVYKILFALHKMYVRKIITIRFEYQFNY